MKRVLALVLARVAAWAAPGVVAVPRVPADAHAAARERVLEPDYGYYYSAAPAAPNASPTPLPRATLAASSSGKLSRRPLLLEVEPAPASSCCAGPRDVLLTSRARAQGCRHRRQAHALKVVVIDAKHPANDAF